MKSNKKIFKTDLINIAQENYFYELIEFSPLEETQLKDFIERMSHKSVLALNKDFLLAFTSHYKLRKMLISKDVPNEKREELEKKIRQIEVNTMENSHTLFENLGARLIKCRTVEDLNFMSDNNLFFEAMMFLSFQYFRTKKMKNDIKRAFEKEPFPASKFWNIISHTMSTNVAGYLSLNPELRIIHFENKTSTSFFTNDQPVFNIKNNIDANGVVKQLELFYPLSPSNAILIHFRNEQKDKVENILASRETVKYFNDMMFKNSDFFMFSNSEQQLIDLKNNFYN